MQGSLGNVETSTERFRKDLKRDSLLLHMRFNKMKDGSTSMPLEDHVELHSHPGRKSSKASLDMLCKLDILSPVNQGDASQSWSSASLGM